jgi:hypothetical protein
VNDELRAITNKDLNCDSAVMPATAVVTARRRYANVPG